MISTRTNRFDSKRSTGKRRTTCTLGSVGTLALAGLLSSLLAIPVAQAIRVDGSPGDDTLEGTGGNDELFGYGGDDKLFGYGGNDRLEGGEGNDDMWGGAGGDVLDGGARYDFAAYHRSDSGITVNLATGIASGGYAQGDVLNDVENLYGSSHADRLTGDDGDNKIFGDAGPDSLEGGDGVDRLSYWASDAGVTVNLATETASGGHADGDIISGFEQLEGSSHDDYLTGDDGHNVLWGLGGDDRLVGGDGNDEIWGDAGADFIDGGAGHDWAFFSGSDSAVTVNLATGAASGGYAQGDTLVGIERLSGSAHDDRLTGDDGDNWLLGRAGADILDGGEGSDYLSYWQSDAGVTVNLATGAASGGHASGDVFSGIEWLRGSSHDDDLTGADGRNRLYGQDGDDRLVGGGGDDSMWGGAGGDFLDGGAGYDHVAYYYSDAGVTVNLDTGIGSGGYAQGDVINDVASIYGSPHADRLTGDDGNNTLLGGAGADVLEGGEGRDLLSYWDSDAGVTVNLATDVASGGHASGDVISEFEWLYGSAHADTLTGSDDDNSIRGLDGDDRIEGAGGDDVLRGGEGRDVLDGGAGHDWLSYWYSDSAVTVNLATGEASGGTADGDTFSGMEGIYGSPHADRLTGDDGDNSLNGGPGADVLDGREGVDLLSYQFSDAGVTVDLATGDASGGFAEGDEFTGFENLEGSAYNDSLSGDGGDNMLGGLEGNDHLSGDAGDDTFVFAPSNGDDTISDFGDGSDKIDLSEFDLPNGYDDVTVHAAGRFRLVPLFPADSDQMGRQGFARIINRSDEAGTVRIDAHDESGAPFGPLTLELDARETVHFNSTDLEHGNPAKGITVGTGQGVGPWRLALISALDIEVLSYVRTSDGFLTSMHDLVQQTSSGHRVVIVNPGRNVNQRSVLRLVNPGGEEAEVRIEGIDDQGRSPGSAVTLSLAAEASRSLSAAALETGDAEGLSGALGTGEGKWQLLLTSSRPLWAMSLLSSPTGHLTNLSTAPDHSDPGEDDGVAVHHVGYFPSAARWEREGVQGFARLVNRSDEAGTVEIEGVDDSGENFGPSTLDIEPGATVHINSQDLETGNPDKGISGGIGAGNGDWRLRVRSSLDLDVLAYVRTSDGFLTSMHDRSPETAAGHRVDIFNPGRNVNQVSRLRLINTGAQAAAIRIEGVDDKGHSPGSAVSLSVAPKTARTLNSQELESGEADGLVGALGTGSGKWRLAVTSEQDIHVMSLLSSPTGHLTNLSTSGAGEVSVDGPSSVRIDLSAHGGGSILLPGVALGELDASDFLFERTESRSTPGSFATHLLEFDHDERLDTMPDSLEAEIGDFEPAAANW